MQQPAVPKPPITVTPTRVATSIEVLLAESARRLGERTGEGWEAGEILARAAELLERRTGVAA